jgi:hypothetical protein
MPKREYDKEREDYDFASVAEGPLDRELQVLVRAFKAWSPDKRAESQRGISMHEQYTLIHFAKRSSVLALREKSIARCEDGLLALAMIDETRIDTRDASWAVGLLAHAIETLNADRERLADQAAAHPRWRRFCCAHGNAHDCQRGGTHRLRLRMVSAWYDLGSRALSRRLT